MKNFTFTLIVLAASLTAMPGMLQSTSPLEAFPVSEVAKKAIAVSVINPPTATPTIVF